MAKNTLSRWTDSKKNQYLRLILFQQNTIHSNLIVMPSTFFHFVHKSEIHVISMKLF